MMFRCSKKCALFKQVSAKQIKRQRTSPWAVPLQGIPSSARWDRGNNRFVMDGICITLYVLVVVVVAGVVEVNGDSMRR